MLLSARGLGYPAPCLNRDRGRSRGHACHARTAPCQPCFPFPTRSCGWDITQDKSIVALAKKHKRSAAEIVLRWEWQQGIVVNPRTKNPQHMQENLSIFNFSLSDEEMTAIRQLKAPTNTSKVCPDPHQIP